jgi:hypothetical protein
MAHSKCKWAYDQDDDKWDTSCGHAFVLTEGTPAENHMVYCCYCGKKISEEKEVKNGGD